ncbi:MAG: hypothetical protein OEO77_07780 [Acidimicrobiia bacterium]|nr:hypothetical protein [Acidimicrobiia bacterium]
MSRISNVRVRPGRWCIRSAGLLAVSALMSASCGPAGGVTTASPNPSAPTTSGTVSPWLAYQWNGQIRVVRIDGTDDRVIAPDAPIGQEHPDWSPDGTQVVFETDFAVLWTVGIDGSDMREIFRCLAPCYSIQDAAWSPDGAEIAFVMAETEDGVTTSRAAILGLDVATGDLRTIFEDTSGRVWLFNPRWSPDGRSVVFEEDLFASDLLIEGTVETRVVAVVPADGSALPTSIARWSGSAAGRAGAPDWHPTSQLIVYSNAGNLHTVVPEGGGERQLTHFDGATEHAIQPTSTPDRDSIVFTYVTGQFGVDDVPSGAMVGLDGSGMTSIGGEARITHPRVQP